MCSRRSWRVQNEDDDDDDQDIIVTVPGGTRKGSPLLHLPELAMENILSRLPAESLCAMAGVNRELRAMCTRNRFWAPLVKAKWGKLVGEAAYTEWCRSVAFHHGLTARSSSKLCRWPCGCIWPFSVMFCQKPGKQPNMETSHHALMMAWYWALEHGKFWFSAQVYNREHGHVGFMLSCYDAEVRYDRSTDTFSARYPPHGLHPISIEEGVEWQRLRASPVNTSPHDLHITGSFTELKPGDHIEIQWRRNKDFPYGWWYGIVGHLDTCDKDSRHCHCHLDGTVWLEFNQYTTGSQWRRWAVNRYTHREEGNDAEGFYGGIRKLQNAEEINTWMCLWPREILD